VEGVQIRKLEPAHIDERGSIFNFLIQECASELGLVERKAGSVAGCHYHQGANPCKNPEKILVVKGKVEFTAKHLDTGETFTQTLTSFTEVTVYPRIWHKYEAVEDCLLLEAWANSGEYEDDLVRVSERELP